MKIFQSALVHLLSNFKVEIYLRYCKNVHIIIIHFFRPWAAAERLWKPSGSAGWRWRGATSSTTARTWRPSSRPQAMTPSTGTTQTTRCTCMKMERYFNCMVRVLLPRVQGILGLGFLCYGLVFRVPLYRAIQKGILFHLVRLIISEAAKFANISLNVLYPSRYSVAGIIVPKKSKNF